MPGTFPNLRTGAIAQYPLLRELRQAAEVVQFLDGTEQAYRQQAAPRRRWAIDLSLLDDAEIARLKEFFELQKGRWGTFAFTDPWDNANFGNCSFESDVFPHTQNEEGRNSGRLLIYEHP